MIMESVAIGLITALATGVLSLVGAILLGKLIPAGRETAARQEADKWKEAYEEKSRALAILEDTVRQQRIVADTTNAVLSALKQSTALGQHTQGGSS